MRARKTRAGGEWTEARFVGFLRTGLRRMSMRWPPIARLALNAARRPYVGANPRQKWEYQCARCRGWFSRKEVEVDHRIPCGQFRALADLQGYVERMFVEPEALDILCEPCHDRKRSQ